MRIFLVYFDKIVAGLLGKDRVSWMLRHDKPQAFG
jgi:hypothetical protein